MVRDELHFAPFSFIKINLNTTENREPSYSFWRTGKRVDLKKNIETLDVQAMVEISKCYDVFSYENDNSPVSGVITFIFQGAAIIWTVSRVTLVF